MMMVTMSEPIHFTPDSPTHRFRFSLRGMMFTVGIIAVLLSLWIPTIRLVTDWKAPEVRELWTVGFLILAETIVVYYIALAGIVGWGVIKRDGPRRRLTRVLVFAPVIIVLAILYTSVLLDALARLPWF